MHPTTHWLSPSTALPGSCRPRDPAFPVGYSCLHIFPSLIHLWPLIVTQLMWLQAGQAPFLSGMHVGSWCTSQTQTRLCIYVCVQGAFSVLHLLQAAGTEGHGHRQDMVASISPVHRQKQSARPSYQRENLPLVVCAHGRRPWDFSCLPVPPSPMVGTHEPAHPNTSRVSVLMVSNVPFHPRYIGPSFFCCPQATLAGAESIPARASLTNGRISMSEASVSPCPLEAQSSPALGELA